MNKMMTVIIAIPVAILVVLSWSFLMAFPVMWLWNWLMPDLFYHVTMQINNINYWQAWGLLTLSGLLIKARPGVKGD